MNENLRSGETETSHLLTLCADAMEAISKDASALELIIGTGYGGVFTGEASTEFNFGVITSETVEIEDGIIDFSTRAKLKQVPALLFIPEDVSLTSEHIQSLGFTHAGKSPLMVYKTDQSTQTLASSEQKGASAMTIQLVDTMDALQVSNSIQAQELNLPIEVLNRTTGENVLNNPRVKIFIGYKDGVPVSTVTAVVHEGDNAVSIWGMATARSQQKKGIGSTTLSTVMSYFDTQGYDTFFLLATEEGQPLYKKAGFETQENLDIYETI